MKKLLLLFAIVLSTNAYSQTPNSELNKYIKGNTNNKEYIKDNKTPKIKLTNNQLAGKDLKTSAKYQYGAIGCGIGATGCFIGSALVKNKFEYDKKTYEVKEKKNNTRNALLVGGGVLSFISLICEINAIQYKLSAGKYLELGANEDGAAIAFNF